MTNPRTDIDIEHFKHELLVEKRQVEKELASVGQKNPSNSEDWEPTPEKMNVSHADPNEVADTIEEYEVRGSISNSLEARLRNIEHVLERMEKGTYGICEVSGELIEKERLEANPAARTNIANKDVSLD